MYATSIDYDADAGLTQTFFATVQNKLHWAITGPTAAEIIHDRADASKPHMGLTSWRGTEPRMTDWITKLDGSLTLNDRDILTGAGKISHALAVEQAKEQFRSYSAERPDRESDFDRFVRQVHANGIEQ